MRSFLGFGYLTVAGLAGLAGLAAVAMGCSSTSTGSGTTTQSKPDDEALCLRMADVVAKAAERCGEPYKANYDAFVAQAQCSRLASIRDANELTQKCLPALETVACTGCTPLSPPLTCADLRAGRLPATCSQQLVRPSSTMPEPSSADLAEGSAGIR